MTWVEANNRRALCGKTWKQGRAYVHENRLKTRLHYGDGFGNEVNFSPSRVNTGGFDGWTIDQAPWTCGLGARDGLGDGWNGAEINGHRLWYRLAQFGWLHWPTRAWEQIGGSPNYDRDNLITTPQELVLGPGGGVSSIYTSALVSWEHLWTTPGGGDISIEWMLEGRRNKEEIVLNQAARQWVSDNAMPSNGAWANDDTYLTMLFRMDGVGAFDWNTNLGDGNDDDGRIELRDASDLLFYMPFDYVWSSVDHRQRVRLHKRIFTNDQGIWLAVGAKLNELMGLPSGDLRFDPTLELRTGADGEDTFLQSNNFSNYSASTIAYVGEYSGIYSHFLLRFDLSEIPENARVVSSSVRFNVDANTYADNAHISNAFKVLKDWISTQARWDNYKMGSAWEIPGATGDTDIGDLMGESESLPPDFLGRFSFSLDSDVVQEWLSDNNGMFLKSKNENDDILTYATGDSSSLGDRPKLTVEYTLSEPKSDFPFHAMRRARFLRR